VPRHDHGTDHCHAPVPVFTERREQGFWFGLDWFGLVGFSFHASLEPQPGWLVGWLVGLSATDGCHSKVAPEIYEWIRLGIRPASIVKHIIQRLLSVLAGSIVFILGALYPSKSGLINKHIVKHHSNISW